MDYYSAIKKKETLPLEKTWMDLEGTMLSEISQTNTMISLVLGIRKTKRNKKTNKSKFTDTKNRLVVARGRVWSVGENGLRGPKGTKFQL